MATTITTDTYYDGTARTAGDTWTINGGILTVRTDTRWCDGAPASMTGSIGAVTISSTLGGGYYLDGTNVRWLAFTDGSGTVPAIGTSITQSAVSGYLLGVWASMTSAPTAVGESMPSTGFIKFREVTGGTFSAGALSGITATASGADVVGWIEVVMTQSVAITVPRLGKFQTRGAWFELGTTSGSANQSIQIPTNGSSTTYAPGLWIETAVAGTYEFYPSIFAAGMISTNLGTDERSKFVLMGTDGTCVIGHNGTDAIGYVPPAGRKIRVPNVFLRQCVSTTRNINAIPHATAGTRPDFTTTNAGAIDVEYTYGDWYFSFTQPYSVSIKHTATFDFVAIAECASAIVVEDGGNGISQSIDARTLTITSCFAGGTITDWVCHRYSSGNTDHACENINSIGQTYTRVLSGIVAYARATGRSYSITQSTGIKFYDCIQFNNYMLFTTSFDCEVYDQDHVDRYVGSTNTTTGSYVVSCLSSCVNIKVDGVTFGLKGTISDVHPYAGVFNAGQSSDIVFRNAGTRSSFLNGGSTNNPAYIFLSSGNNYDVRVQRCYVTPTRTGAISTVNTDKNVIYEHIYGDFGDSLVVASLNSVAKNCGGTNSTTGQASVYGTHFFDAFTSDTVGGVVLALNEPTTETVQYVTIVSGNPRFTSAGNITMLVAGDELIVEMSYYVKGCTALTNSAPVVTGTNVSYSSGPNWGNHAIYYQIDTGSGWNGTWKNLTASNLSGESISPAGFKLKYRIVCITSNATNLLTYIRILTDSTLEAQTNNLYDLDSVATSLTLTGLQPGSEVHIFRASDGLDLANVESSSTSFTYNYTWTSNITVNIVIHHIQYEYLRYDGYVLTSNVGSIPVVQKYDRNYSNPV